MYLHLYYDDERAMEERARFNVLLDRLEAELREGIRIPDHETLYQKYYELTQTSCTRSKAQSQARGD
ncbi:MAG: hypothetical protein BWX81_00414 [Spirochaetes bacterium ADurb.Bin110]|nr:MAG: hypothetical protein BWX81_00414 [Spirochaetes bacterium ADurb.Bin110]